MLKTFPILYAKNKNGVWKQWSISVNVVHEGVVITTEHGQYQGKKITDTQTITENKRGYDSLYDQALHNAQSKWNYKHQRQGYKTTMDDDNDDKQTSSSTMTLKPMLAKTYDNCKHLMFPLFIQPKIDGLRCLATPHGLFSRTGCPFFGLDIIKNVLKKYFEKHEDCVVDGELYSDEMSFEELSGYCRRQKEIPTGKKVFFHVFDVFIYNQIGLGFEKRMRLFPKQTEYVRIVPTMEIGKKEDIHEHLTRFIKDGYEGIILRNKEGHYHAGHRSWDLQKYKLFQEEEFTIVGFTEGKGREKGMVIWECLTQEGKPFHVRPEGTHTTRKQMFQNAEDYIGKKLTVVFQEYTQDKIPRFPVAKAIRERY